MFSRIISSLILSAGFFLTIIAQDHSLYEKKIFIQDGDTLLYRVLLPENFSKEMTYPLVLFLHGAGERGADNEKQLTHGAGLFLTEENRRAFPSIVLFPQCPSNESWTSVSVDRSSMPFTFDFDYASGVQRPLELVMALVENFKDIMDESRIYIMGLSMGGMGTFQAIYENPDLFAAAAPICGGADLKAYEQTPNTTPFWIFHGDADVVVPVAFSRDMHSVLSGKQAEVTYTEYPGVNHNSWDNALAEPGLLQWIFSKRRD